MPGGLVFNGLWALLADLQEQTCGIIDKNMSWRLLGHGRLIGIIQYIVST